MLHKNKTSLFIITVRFQKLFLTKTKYINIHINIKYISVHYKKSSTLEDRVVSVSSAEDMEPG